MTVYVIHNSEGKIIDGAFAQLSSLYVPREIDAVDQISDCSLFCYDWTSLNSGNVLKVKLREDYKSTLYLRAMEKYENAISELVEKYPESERMAWPQKLSEARVWLTLSDDERAERVTEFPLLLNEAGEEGMTELAQKIIEKHNTFAVAYGQATRALKEAQKQIDTLSSVDDVKNYLGG
jgi:hypothetical protein